MQNQMSFINLFLIPLIGEYLFLRKKSYQMTFSLKILFLYAYFTCMDIIASHFILIILRKFGMIIVPESAFYTLISLMSTIIIYFCSLVLIEWFHIELRLKKKNEEK